MALGKSVNPSVLQALVDNVISALNIVTTPITHQQTESTVQQLATPPITSQDSTDTPVSSNDFSPLPQPSDSVNTKLLPLPRPSTSVNKKPKPKQQLLRPPPQRLSLRKTRPLDHNLSMYLVNQPLTNPQSTHHHYYKPMDNTTSVSLTPSFSILQWSILGLSANLATLLAANAENNFDILVLQETLLPENGTCNIKNYTAFHSYHIPGQSRGTSIFVKSSIHSQLITPAPECRDLFGLAANEPAIILGDFNAHHLDWNDPSTSSAHRIDDTGRHIKLLLDSFPDVSLLNARQATHTKGGVLNLVILSTSLLSTADWIIHPFFTSDL